MKTAHLTRYFARANGQTKANNKVIKNVTEKIVNENPCEWYNLLIWYSGRLEPQNAIVLEQLLMPYITTMMQFAHGNRSPIASDGYSESVEC